MPLSQSDPPPPNLGERFLGSFYNSYNSHNSHNSYISYKIIKGLNVPNNIKALNFQFSIFNSQFSRPHYGVGNESVALGVGVDAVGAE